MQIVYFIIMVDYGEYSIRFWLTNFKNSCLLNAMAIRYQIKYLKYPTKYGGGGISEQTTYTDETSY